MNKVNLLDSYSPKSGSMLSSDGSSAPVCPAKVQSVDDFVPDDGLDKSFLEDSLPLKTKVPQRAPAPAVDSDR